MKNNNINIISKNDTTMISTDINVNNDLNMFVGGELLIGTATEQHISKETNYEWDVSISRAALGGAITGLATGLGVRGSEIAGKFLSGAVNNAIGGTAGRILGAATTGAIKISTLTYTSSIGSVMSQATIQGGSFKDVVKAGSKTAVSKDTLKSVVIGAVIGGVGGALGEWIKDVKSKYNNSLTQEQIKNHMKPISVEESNLKPGSYFDNKVGVNSYYNNENVLMRAGTTNEIVPAWKSNQNFFLKTLNLLPGSPSFADFHDALNLPDPWNMPSIIPAYPISQFNALYKYYPLINQYNKIKNEK